ncbi:hypothetical protein PV327_002431 [Microctonus hyperodae]|uniref:Uncharacterized protein n=1 Tax=Microctonus hyperodae TaxID=165561 RepID=A0AA39KP69_MICHY|nr:hypothetical protein PV327_002431 [Microctonus hyperodae]
MSLNCMLPAPSQVVWDREDEAREQKLRQRLVSALVKTFVTAPSYTQRKKWVPRTQEDFGDGGAFPEIHNAQYPLGMGFNKKESNNAVAIQLNEQGKIKYDVIARQGHGKNKIVHSKLSDLLPAEIINENDLVRKK